MHSGVQLSGRSHSPHSDYYAWEFPGAPARVHLHLGVVADLERQLLWQYQYNPEAQLFGVMLGRVIPHGAIIIDDFERVEGGENEEKLKPVLAKWAAKADSELGVVGYYRSQSRDGFALTQEDLLLIHSQFAQSLSLVMLIKPSATSVATAGFFFALSGEAKSRFSFGRFPFDREQLAAERPALTDLAAASALPQVAPISAPRDPIMAPRKTLEESIAEDTVPAMQPSRAIAPVETARVEVIKTPARDRQWIWFAAGAALAVLALGVELFQWFGQSADSAVALQATRLSHGLEVSWNQDARVFNGDGALLFIQEGEARKQYYLDLSKLRKGHLLYYPYSKGEVQVRMEVLLRGGQGSATVDTVVAGLGNPAGDARSTTRERLAQNTNAPDDADFHPSVRPITDSGTSSSVGSAVVLLEPPDPSAVLSLPGVQKVAVPSATHAVSLSVAAQPREVAEAAPATALAAQNSSVVKLDAGNLLVEPRVAHSVMPQVPADSKVWQGQPVLIDVLVQIDTEGKVVSAVPRSPKTQAGAMLGKLAVAAAQQWTFEPAYAGAKRVPSEMFLRFQF